MVRTPSSTLWSSISIVGFLDWVLEDGHCGLRLPKFIDTLWAIRRTRNDQVFRKIRATVEIFKAHIRDSNQQHSRFTADDHPPRAPPPAPNYGYPPGFSIANLGRLQFAIPDIILQIDGSWDKSNGCGGAVWVAMQHMRPTKWHGVFLHASSALQIEVVACRCTINWVRTTSFTNILILTDSTSLISVLGSKTSAESQSITL